tara:strand:+ start:2408 stop:3052 length:645 start_codon:yes stop_codon:yes gene_type:complete
MTLDCKTYELINKTSKIILIIILSIISIYMIIYSIYYIITPCDVEKNLNLNITEICPEKKYEMPSQSLIQREIENEREVFHIKNQNLTYKQAIEKCGIYNSVLATKQQLIDAYNKGASWCTYGWSENQNAFYPVQKCMQTEDCKSGLNGGYFDKPDLKFGVNCFGIKPENKNIELKPTYCKEKTFCEKEENEKACIRSPDDYISPFNEDKWSMF